MTISSSALFHFTSKENLISVLSGKHFYVQYVKENLAQVFGSNQIWYIPMVCFCDIPLKQIKVHTNFYGKYGIGLTKDWGQDKEMSPILYAHPKSSVAINLTRLLQDLFAENNTEINYKKIQEKIFHLLANLKPYEGETFNKSTKQNENKILYDEREWRYYPPIELLGFDQIHILGHTIQTEEEIRILNNRLKDFGLMFNIPNIKYIIVEKEEEITDMVKTILDLDTYDKDEKYLLVSKIISLDQIHKDF